MSKKEEEVEREESPLTVTGNRPPADRSTNATEEGKRQDRAIAEQQEALKDAPKASSKKPSAEEDPFRYYQGSEYQKKIEEENTKISESTDADERRKMSANLRKESYPEKKEREKEEKESESRTTKSETKSENTMFGGRR
jgi:hypothetical protein